MAAYDDLSVQEFVAEFRKAAKALIEWDNQKYTGGELF